MFVKDPKHAKGNANEVLAIASRLIEKVQMRVDELHRQQESLEKKFKKEKLPFDFSTLRQVYKASNFVAAAVMSRASTAFITCLATIE